MGLLVAATAVLTVGCLRFAPPDRIPTSETAGDVAHEVAVADVTGDGRAEVLVDTGVALRPLEYCGPGCLAALDPLPGAGLGIAVDVDGDGITDLLDDGVVYWGSAGDAGRAPGLSVDDSTSINPLPGHIAEIADFDGDGHADLLLGEQVFTYYVQFSIALGDGEGGFELGGVVGLSVLNAGGAATGIGDVDGDGDDEALLTAVNSLRVVDHTSTMAAPLFETTVGGAYWTTGDIDGDGRDDLGVNPYNSGDHLRFHRSTGTGFEPFPDWMEFPTHTPSWVSGFALRDMDDDGWADLLLDDRAAETTWYGGSGDGGFPYRALGTVPEDSSLRPWRFGDLDGDGLDDVVVPTGGPHAEVEVLINDAITGSP